MDYLLAIAEKRKREIKSKQALDHLTSLISRNEENPEKRMNIIKSPSLDADLMAYHPREYTFPRARRVESGVFDHAGTSAVDDDVAAPDDPIDTDTDTDAHPSKSKKV